MDVLCVSLAILYPPLEAKRLETFQQMLRFSSHLLIEHLYKTLLRVHVEERMLRMMGLDASCKTRSAGRF